MSTVFAVDACRTPAGKIKGALAGAVARAAATLWEAA
jgi:hypothetical protein